MDLTIFCLLSCLFIAPAAAPKTHSKVRNRYSEISIQEPEFGDELSEKPAYSFCLLNSDDDLMMMAGPQVQTSEVKKQGKDGFFLAP